MNKLDKIFKQTTTQDVMESLEGLKETIAQRPPKKEITPTEKFNLEMDRVIQHFTDKGIKKIEHENLIKDLIRVKLGQSGALNTEKGIFLSGAVGVGKTDILKAIFPEAVFLDTKMLELKYAKEGIEMLNNILKYKQMICLDDLGRDGGEASNYGNKTNVIEYLVSKLYVKWKNEGMKVLFTTNLKTTEQLSNIYGDRIVSRLKEMSTFVNVLGRDLRADKFETKTYE